MNNQVTFEPLGKNDLPANYFDQEMVAPVAGSIGGGYLDRRSHGPHMAGDISAPAGYPVLAPGNMEFVAGKQGGKNLRDNDWWSWWKDTDTGREYRFAHHGPIAYKPGEKVSKGQPWASVGNAIKGTHLHMAVLDQKGNHVDWMKPLGFKRGMNLTPGRTLAENIADYQERRANKIAATTGGNIQFEPLSPEEMRSIPGVSFEPIPESPETSPMETSPKVGTIPNPLAGEAQEQAQGGDTQSVLRPAPTPIYEMEYQDPQAMKNAVLNPPNMGYRPGIAKPILQATGLAVGGMVGTAAGSPGGPVGAAAGAIGGGTTGYALAEKANDALQTYMGGRPTPTLEESVRKTATEDMPTGAMMTIGGEIASPIVRSVIKGAGKVIRPLLGKMSGTGEGAIEEAIMGSQAFKDAMRGKISGEDVVKNAQDALQTIRNNRSIAYQTSLKNIKNIKDPITGEMVELDSAPIRNKLISLMNRYNVKFTPNGEVDTSRIAMGKKGRNDIEDIIDTVKNWGSKDGDNTAIGLDTLKRQLDDFYSESSQARAFVASLRNEVKKTISDQIPEYSKMTEGYAEVTSLIKDIEANLMMRKQGMSGRIVADQTLRRLTSAMRDNFPLRRELVETLGAKSGEDIAAMVAGNAMSPMLGRGLSGNMMVGEAILAHLWNPKFYPILVASSPRIQGEFLHIYGKALKEMTGISIPLSKSFAVWMGQKRKEAELK